MQHDLNQWGDRMKPQPRNAVRWAAYGAFLGAAFIVLSQGSHWVEIGLTGPRQWAAFGEVIGGAVAGALLGAVAALVTNFFGRR